MPDFKAKSCSPRSWFHLLQPPPLPQRAQKLRARGPLPLSAPPSAPASPSTPSPAGGDCVGGGWERWVAGWRWALGRRRRCSCARRPLRGNLRPAAQGQALVGSGDVGRIRDFLNTCVSRRWDAAEGYGVYLTPQDVSHPSQFSQLSPEWESGGRGSCARVGWGYRSSPWAPGLLAWVFCNDSGAPSALAVQLLAPAKFSISGFPSTPPPSPASDLGIGETRLRALFWAEEAETWALRYWCWSGGTVQRMCLWSQTP